MESSAFPQVEVALEHMKGITQAQPPDRAYLTAMAEAVGNQERSEVSSTITTFASAPTTSVTSPGQKRKRAANEQSSPESRRAKRSVPTVTMPVTESAQPAQTSEPQADPAAYAESAVEAAQQAAAAAHVGASTTSPTSFTPVQQQPNQPVHVASPQAASDVPSVSSTAAATTAAAALGSMYPTIHVPQSTESTFVAQSPNEHDQSHNNSPTFHSGDAPRLDGLQDNTAVTPTGSGAGHTLFQSSDKFKPAVGSEEWHKQRKDNHKQVERRRRETINEGINELAKIVPGCEKNKGSILQRAVAFITQLKANEASNIEKWTLEKLLTEQAITELSSSNDKLKQECERAYGELNQWKEVAQTHGLQLPEPKNEPSA